MYALYEDGGRFHAGRVMAEAEASAQIELDSGKRVKVKAANLLLRFEAPAPAELLAQAQQAAAEIDLDLAWEFAPDAEFGFADFARDYFSANAGAVQQAAALLRLFDAPHYFRRLGKGRFRKAPEEQVKAALIGIERKKQVAAQIDAWADALVAGECAPEVREQMYRILFKPDRNAPEYKAVVEAARRSQRSPLDLLKAAGAIDSPYQFHWRRFLFEQFPKGLGFPAAEVPAPPPALPRADVQAFSIDDSSTTEIDDALSLQGLGSGTVTLGVHIAAPALAIEPGSVFDRGAAAERLSTVYMPGGKLTMLPDAVVERYTLAEGRDCPALSLYLTLDEATLEVRAHETRVETVPITANLRHDQLDDVITEASLEGRAPAAYPFATELAFLLRLARRLKARREQVRGKPELFTRPDFSFRLLDREGQPGGNGADGAPDGSERIEITQRKRGAPLDLIVSEVMILANSTWGGWLAELGVPGIYRSQASLAPGNKVRMGTRPAPHAGMGVAQYTWATSPLRRYVDLVNQWQLIACARHGRTAALAAPFKPKDAQLLSVVSAFEAAHAAYQDFQHAIERYWALRWMQQEGIKQFDATVMKEGLVRANAAPLVLHVPGCEMLPRGAQVRLRLTAIDLLTLDMHAQLVARIDDSTLAAAAATTAADDDGEDDGQAAIGAPLALAIDIADADADATSSGAAPAGAAPASAAPAAP